MGVPPRGGGRWEYGRARGGTAVVLLGAMVLVSLTAVALFGMGGVPAVGLRPANLATATDLDARARAADKHIMVKQRVFASAVQGDDDFARLECPQGQTIHSIDFASFGTPKRAADGELYEDPKCHAALSRSVAATACLQQSACQLAPDNEKFGGDPCPEVEAKRLVVQVTCGTAEAGQFSFAGCYAHNSHKLISIWTDQPTSWVDCRDLAKYRESDFFALEHPAGYPAGEGNCGLAGDYSGEGHIGLASCKEGLDYNGRPLGGPDALAVYTVAKSAPVEGEADGPDSPDGNAPALGQGKSPHSFEWSLKDNDKPWSDCEPGCGTSLKKSEYVCVRSDATIVDDSLCVADDKPVAAMPCESYATCTYRFDASGYSTCTPGCGASAMWQKVFCLRVELDQHVEDGLCHDAGQLKPALSLACEDFSLCSYDWVWTNDWNSCDAKCGAGTESRDVQCQRTDLAGENPVTKYVDPETLPDSYAKNNCLNKPDTTRECWITRGCEYSWVGAEWSECDAQCGVEGMQSRSVACRVGSVADDAALGLAAGPQEPYTSDENCDPADRPAKNRICNNDESCTFEWRTDEWEECPPGCGFLQRQRDVTCVRSDGEQMPGEACTHATDKDGNPLEMPPRSEACTSRATCSYGWREPTAWDDAALQCSETCGQGVKQRTSNCEVQNPDSPFNAEIVADSLCTPVDDPEWLQIECFDYTGCCHEWVIGEWEDAKCAEACGKSRMPRSIHCERRRHCGEPATALETVVESFCEATPKPESTKECYSVAQCCYKWQVEEWSQCEPSCGMSKQVREVWCERCDNQQVENAECTVERAGPQPPTGEACSNFDTCSYAWHMKTADLGTCFDGFRNGDETAIDCGGSCPDCKVDGGWSDYGAWTTCTAQCGKGTVSSVRSCTSPAPANGGKDCEGEATLTKECGKGPCQVNFEEECTYTIKPHAFQMELAAGLKQKVTSIKAGKSHVLIKVVGTADMDISLETLSKERLVSYSTPNINWGQADLTYNNAKIHSCTDGCSTDVAVRFNGDGKVHEMKGDASYSSEYIYFERSTDELVLFVTGYGPGHATVTYEYDCPGTCDSCMAFEGDDAPQGSGPIAVGLQADASQH